MEFEESETTDPFLSSDDYIVMQDLLTLLANQLSVPASLLPSSRMVWDKVRV